ncbi:DNA/RNA helicase domain-containing protein [Secundilactobacillus silagei]|uniref:DNA/RNA helicase domain-containing protein n=1 Tax=Secundilactobacillus silagei TaxID=1293415 RepID=UPI000A91DEEC|nr:DNA/RNA helicase domain-containing protein [Secundilactobacillus silagei]
MIQKNKVDIVLVDEAHLLWTQGKQAYRGKNQLDDIMARSKVTVAIFDPKQVLKTEEYLEETDIENIRNRSKSQGNFIELKNQLRVQADNQTIDWIRAITDSRRQILPFHADSKRYDLKVFDDAAEMYRQIKQKKCRSRK